MMIQTIPSDVNMDVADIGPVFTQSVGNEVELVVESPHALSILPTYVSTAQPDDAAVIDLDTDILHGKEARGLAAASRRALRRRMSEDDSVPR